MKRLVPLILVACSTRSAPDVDERLPAPAKAAREPAAVASHGAAIESLAVSDDGRAALSQDAIGGTRLWPTLDGTHEPFVVGLAMATQLALGRDGESFVIAALDQVGGIEIVRVGGDGNVITRSRIAPDPAIDAIAIAPQGIVALCADQTIAIYAPSGERIARLAGDAGERLVSLVARKDRVLVIIARHGVLRGRWLDGTSWGITTPTLRGDGDTPLAIDATTRMRLSPSGARLLVSFGGASRELDLTTGSPTDTKLGTNAAGYPDDGDVLELEEASAAEPAIGDGIVVAAKGASLVLGTRTQVLQLGYQIRDVAEMHVDGDRIFVSGDGHVAVVDASLAQRVTLALPIDTRTVGEVMPIDDRFVIATHTFAPGSWWTMSVNDLEKRETTQAMPHPLDSAGIRYEPSTQLLTIRDKAASYLVRWDAAKRSFELWYTLAKESKRAVDASYTLAGAPADVHLLDPAKNDGIVAIALRRLDGTKVEIGEYMREQLVVGRPIVPIRTFIVDGVGVDVDTLGTVYVVAGGKLVGYRHGAEVLRIADVITTRLFVHPRGTYIAILADQTMRLYDSSGALHWTIAAPLAQRIAWLGDELIVDYAGGLGKIDVATGALMKRACGWTFGLSALSTNDSTPGDSICDAQ